MNNNTAEKKAFSDTCPNCFFNEGICVELSEPEKTEEGWVVICAKGHKLYVAQYFFTGRRNAEDDGMLLDMLEKKACSVSGPCAN